jgi:hypothetical protein
VLANENEGVTVAQTFSLISSLDSPESVDKNRLCDDNPSIFIWPTKHA